MAVAHRHGITHCDIKPKNILIDKVGEPRLIDFGMARLRHVWSDCTPSTWGGTVSFMAPEQARLEIDRIGPRSDIFALGGVLYFLLTGQAPFAGETYEEVWDRARRCDFEAGALRAAKVPRGLERICLKAMAADPADRYATAEAFQRALEGYLAWPKVLAASAGVCGVVLLGLLLYFFVPRPATQTTTHFIVPSQARPSADHVSIPTPAGPLKGRINLLVVKSKDGTRRRLRLEDPSAVPVRALDEFRIEARLDRPAYLYLFWVGSEGKVAPLYPWKEHDWSQRPADERKVSGAELPEIFDDILEIPASPPGLETLVLLAREYSPSRRRRRDQTGPGTDRDAGFLASRIQTSHLDRRWRRGGIRDDRRYRESPSWRRRPDPRHPQPEGPEERRPGAADPHRQPNESETAGKLQPSRPSFRTTLGVR